MAKQFQSHQDFIKYVHTPDFQDKLLKELYNHGAKQDNIKSVLLTGSCNYLDNFDDIDLHIIVYYPFYGMHHKIASQIDGRNLDLIFYTEEDLMYAVNSRYASFFWCFMPYDSLVIYGVAPDCKQNYNILEYPGDWKYIAERFYNNFILPTELPNDYCHKRYWNFLLFYYKIITQSHNLSVDQLQYIQQAHDKQITKQECLEKYKYLLHFIDAHTAH